MEVEVKLYGTLRQHRPQTAVGAPHHPFSLTVAPGTTITALAAKLGIPEGLVNAAAVNGQSVDADTVLQAGDSVNLFPPSAGGSA